MCKRMPLILVTVLLLGAGAAQDAAKAELKKLQGTWKVVSMTTAGKPLPPEQVAGMQILFRGEEMTIGAKGGKGGNTMPMTLDPTTKPKALDLTITRGDQKVVWKCIYAL